MEAACLPPLLQNATQMPLAVENSDNFKRHSRRSVHDSVVLIPRQSPESQLSVGEVGSRVAMHRRFGDKGAGFIDCLLNSFCGDFIILRDESPYCEDVRFSLGSENVSAHCAVERQASFIAWISRRA